MGFDPIAGDISAEVLLWSHLVLHVYISILNYAFVCRSCSHWNCKMVVAWSCVFCVYIGPLTISRGI